MDEFVEYADDDIWRQHIEGEKQMDRDKLREALAAYTHKAWAGWMRYMFEQGVERHTGSVIIPVWWVNRWRRQMNTDYVDLPDDEKESNRDEADKILAIVEAE